MAIIPLPRLRAYALSRPLRFVGWEFSMVRSLIHSVVKRSNLSKAERVISWLCASRQPCLPLRLEASRTEAETNCAAHQPGHLLLILPAVPLPVRLEGQPRSAAGAWIWSQPVQVACPAAQQRPAEGAIIQRAAAKRLLLLVRQERGQHLRGWAL